MACGCSLRGGEKTVKPLFIFSYPEHSTGLFPDLILSVSSQTLLLFLLNFCLCHYLYFCCKCYLLGKVKRPSVMGTVTSSFLFLLPSKSQSWISSLIANLSSPFSVFILDHLLCFLTYWFCLHWLNAHKH